MLMHKLVRDMQRPVKIRPIILSDRYEHAGYKFGSELELRSICELDVFLDADDLCLIYVKQQPYNPRHGWMLATVTLLRSGMLAMIEPADGEGFAVLRADLMMLGTVDAWSDPVTPLPPLVASDGDFGFVTHQPPAFDCYYGASLEAIKEALTAWDKPPASPELMMELVQQAIERIGAGPNAATIRALNSIIERAGRYADDTGNKDLGLALGIVEGVLSDEQNETNVSKTIFALGEAFRRFGMQRASA